MPGPEEVEDSQPPLPAAPAKPGGPSALQSLRISASSAYYSLAGYIGLRRLRDYLQGTIMWPCSADPVWILGVLYQNAETGEGPGASLDQEVLHAVLSDFMSRIWISYRQGFPPIGDSGFTSDVGWGCTFRSGQMLLAQACVVHLVGRQWRRKLEQEYPEEVAQVLRWFWDHPAQQHPFSLHALCAAGEAQGVAPGKWLGPAGFCQLAARLVNRVQPGGLRVALIASSGGGAPVLSAQRLLAEYEAPLSEEAGPQAAEPQGEGAEPQAEGAAQGPQPGGGGRQRGLLVLVPLMLGATAKLNPVYVPALRATLAWPQSMGILGGRPASSHYFVGVQGQAALYLDPHHPQPVTRGAAADLETYFCSTLRLLPLSSLDPSLALGFYCRSPDDVRDLAERFAALEAGSPGAPLVCVSEQSPLEDDPQWRQSQDLGLEEGAEGSPGGISGERPAQGREEWEVL